MKRASVMEHGDSLYLHPFVKTKSGTWINTVPYIKVKSNCIPAAKGKFALEVLDASREGVPDPSGLDDGAFAAFELAGVESWQTFLAQTKGLHVEADGILLRLIPLQFDAKDYGFAELAPKAIVLPIGAALQEIGVAIEEALRRCE